MSRFAGGKEVKQGFPRPSTSSVFWEKECLLLAPRDGTLIKELTNQKMYLIRNGTKYWISSPEEFRQLGLAEPEVKIVPMDH
jgi:hypothetical protein